MRSESSSVGMVSQWISVSVKQNMDVVGAAEMPNGMSGSACQGEYVVSLKIQSRVLNAKLHVVEPQAL